MAELRVKGTGTLKLFENDNTSSVTIASPASLGGDRTITLPDGDVTLGDNTPAFQAGLSSSQSITNDTYVKITCDTEVFDTDGTYDNTTNYRWTPAVVGKYYVYCLTRFLTATDFDNFYIVIYKNGAIHFLSNTRNTNYDSQFISGIVDCDADDYFEAFVYQTTAGAQDIIGEVRQTCFGGYKIIT